MIAQNMVLRRWCWPCCIILIILVIIIWVYVCPGQCPPVDPPRDAHLVIEHEDLVAFAQINNSFSSQLDASNGCTDLKNFWSGMLFQLGDYTFDCARRENVEITRASGEVITLLTGEFDWINIVAAREELDASAVPMLPEEISKLMPPRSSTSACEGAPLHARMNIVSDIITFWQGSNGYDFDARYDTPLSGLAADSKHNSYAMRFNDDFEVWVYDLDDDCVPGAPTGHTEPLHLTDVVEIRVNWEDPGVGSGVRMDPPMP